MAVASDTPSQSLIQWAGGARVTLAIVFTDIVDSTATGRQLGDEAMIQLCELHFAKSRQLIADHGGRWIKNLGDGDLAVFHTVEQAFDYALALRDDPGPSALRLRAGIHIGPTDVRETDIRGGAVNFASRVGGANKGAEIWLSSHAFEHLVALKATRHANLRWHDHPGVELKGLGAYPLWSLSISGSGRSLAELEPHTSPNKSQVAEPAASGPSGAELTEILRNTMANPKYADDIARLDRFYDRRSVINKETIILVVGIEITAELLDRPVAEVLRDEIDRRGGHNSPYRRAIVLTDQGWEVEAQTIARNAVISVGGPPVNKLSRQIDKEPRQDATRFLVSDQRGCYGRFQKNDAGLPQVGLWGENANKTREAVELYMKAERGGLDEFLRLTWYPI